MPFLHRSVREHWVGHCKQTNEGKHFIVLGQKNCFFGGDGWI